MLVYTFLSLIMSECSSTHPCPLSSLAFLCCLVYPKGVSPCVFIWLTISFLTFLFSLFQSPHFVPDFLIFGCGSSPGPGIISLLHSPSCMHPLWRLLIFTRQLLNSLSTILLFSVFGDLVIKKLRFGGGHVALPRFVMFLSSFLCGNLHMY